MPSQFAIGDQLREQALAAGYVYLECEGCSQQAHITDPPKIAELVEHAVFDHATRYGIVGIKITSVIDAYELALQRGTVPQTEWEQRWREERAREHATASA